MNSFSEFVSEFSAYVSPSIFFCPPLKKKKKQMFLCFKGLPIFSLVTFTTQNPSNNTKTPLLLLSKSKNNRYENYLRYKMNEVDDENSNF